MILTDVNVLIYAQRTEADRHDEYRDWLQSVVESDEAYGVSELVLSGFLRITTQPKIFKTPTPLRQALRFVEALRNRPNCVPIRPGPRHWEIFSKLCSSTGATGNLIPDAYYAALAIESGSEWITTDRDYAKFEGLRWRHPLKSSR